MAPALMERLILAAAIALLVVGATIAWTSANAVKRLAGVMIAQTAALLSAASLGAGSAAMAGLALMLASLLIGVALIVRLQEGYGGIEAPDIDRADAADDVKEPRA